MTNFKTKDGKEVKFTSTGVATKAKTKKVKELEKRVKDMEKTVNKMGGINWMLIKREQERAKWNKEQKRIANKEGYDSYYKRMDAEDKAKKKNLTGVSPKPKVEVKKERKQRINHYEDAKLTLKIREMMDKMKNEVV